MRDHGKCFGHLHQQDRYSYSETRWPSLLVQLAFMPSLFGKGRQRRHKPSKCKGLRRVDILNLNLTLTPQLVELLNASISINSITFEDIDSESGAMEFIGSKTETALLKFAKDLGWANYKD